MRPIKFRAWTGQTMMYQENQYLGSFLRRVVLQITLEHGLNEPREHESYLPKGTKIDDYLLEFTGLLDGHNKEICEGDIIQSNEGRGWVVWDSSHGQWILQSFAWWLPLCDTQNPEILGNTKEHWYLMEGKERPKLLEDNTN